MTALPPRPASGGSRAARLLASTSRPPDADRAALCATLPAIHSIFALFRGQGSHPSPPPSLRVLPLPTGAEAVGRRGDGEGPGDGCIHAPRARCAASAPSGRPVEDVPSLPQAVPAPPLLLCSGLRTAPCLYTTARSWTARFHLVSASAVRAALCTARMASHTAAALPPPLQRWSCTVVGRRRIARSLAAAQAGPGCPHQPRANHYRAGCILCNADGESHGDRSALATVLRAAHSTWPAAVRAQLGCQHPPRAHSYHPGSALRDADGESQRDRPAPAPMLRVSHSAR